MFNVNIVKKESTIRILRGIDLANIHRYQYESNNSEKNAFIVENR